jgi:hypothetical protein
MAALAGIQRQQLAVPEGSRCGSSWTAFARDIAASRRAWPRGWAGREALRVAESVRDAMRRRMVQWTAS